MFENGAIVTCGLIFDLLLHTQCLLSILPAAKHFLFLMTSMVESISIITSLIYGSQWPGTGLGTSY